MVLVPAIYAGPEVLGLVGLQTLWADHPGREGSIAQATMTRAPKPGAAMAVTIPRLLTDAELDACEAILSGAHYRVAYQKATGNSNAAAAAEFLEDDDVRIYLAVRRMELRERTGFSDRQWLEEVANMAFYDPAEIVMESISGPEDIAKLPLHIRKLIVGWKNTEYGFELKLVDKQKALDMLAKHQGLYQKDRQNDRDTARMLMESVFWRFVVALHVHEGISIEEAQLRARREPEEVEAWGKEKGFLAPAASGEIVQ